MGRQETHGEARLGARPEQHEGREGPSMPAVRSLELAEDGAHVENESLDLALVEDGERVVVRAVSLVL